MVSTRKARKQSKMILENMTDEQKKALAEIPAPKKAVRVDKPGKKSFCERHPRTCKAGEVVGMVGVGAGIVALDMATGGAGFSEGVLDPIFEKSKKKITDIQKTHEARENSKKILADMQKKSEKKTQTKTKTATKKKSPTVQKRPTTKKSTASNKKPVPKKKTVRKPKDELDYWRII